MTPKGKAVVWIGLEFFRQMVTKGWRIGLGEMVECIDGLPEGAEIVDVQFKQDTLPHLELVVEHPNLPLQEKPVRITPTMCAKRVDDRQVEQELTHLQRLLSSHRAGKLLQKGKTFVVVAVDEPYFQDVYNSIRAQETFLGRWTDDDERCYQESLNEWWAIQEKVLAQGREG